MAFRFGRSFKVAPGVRVNVGKKSGSLTVGPRGASVNVGSKGAHANVGIPGTGISGRKKIGGGGSGAGTSAGGGSVGVKISLQDDGTVEFLDENDNPLPKALVSRLKKERGEELRAWLADRCEHWNQDIEEILNLHHGTPAPDPPKQFEREPFLGNRPEAPTPRQPGFLDKLWPGRIEKIEKENREKERRFKKDLAMWESLRGKHEAEEDAREVLFREAREGNPEVIGALLHATLEDVEWPRETLFDFRVEDEGTTLWLDVDLPEIEDLPDQTARPSKRGYRVLVKDKSAKQLREEYMTHVHAIGFRVLGETFHLLPNVKTVYLSGYSQRLDESTGHVGDEYLYSVRVDRSEWEHLNHSNVEAIDLPQCLEQFELRRKMTKTGIFKAVEPFQPGQPAQ